MTKNKKLLSNAATVANFILGGEGVLFVLVWLYFIYYYGWTGQRQFASQVGIVCYYILPAVMATVLFLSLRLKSDRKVRLAMVVLAITAALYAGELFLSFWTMHVELSRLRSEEAEKVQLANQFGASFDRREKFEVIDDLRKQGVDAIPAVLPRFMMDMKQTSLITINGAHALPLGGIANKVTVLCNEGGDYTIYESDEHGFHNPKGIWESGRVGVSALGDSFTHGYCVSSGKNFVALIRNRYPTTLNLGMGGNGPLLMLATLKEYLPRLTPKIVLWFYFEQNDLSDLKKERQNRLLIRYLESNFYQGLLNRQRDIDRALIGYVRAQETIRKENSARLAPLRLFPEIVKLTTLRQNLGLVYGKDRSEPEESLEGEGAEIGLFRQIMSEAMTTVGSWGGLLYFVYLPTWERYAHPQRASKSRELVLKIANSLDVPIIDIHRVFEAHGDPLSLFPFRRGWHYNQDGHRLVAQEVLRIISKSQAAP